MNMKNDSGTLSVLEEKIAYRFKNIDFLKNALIHTSYINEVIKGDLSSNERLEFLGDSVLSLCVSTYLYKNFQYMEGHLTKLRALIVCEESLSKVAGKLDLGKFIQLGKGEEQTGGRMRNCILADAMEALIAAIYLDSDFQTVYQFVIRNFKDIISDADSGNLDKDYKSMLQERLQKDSVEVVRYDIYNENGPAHDKIYFAHAIYMDKIIGEGMGKSKKLAQKSAAEDAYKKMFGQ